MTIAQQIKWDFKTNGELNIQDKNGNLIYWENSSGFWTKYERNSQGKVIYFEDSGGYWEKFEYDSKGKEIYYETSRGEIIDDRPNQFEGKEIVIDRSMLSVIEKAKELVDRFYLSLPNNGHINSEINSCENRYDEAIDCAIITCDEVLGYMGSDRGHLFWSEVKKIIQTKKFVEKWSRTHSIKKGGGEIEPTK